MRSITPSTSSIEASRAARSSWSGEPGIGKTRLLRELARLAETRGYLVLAGSASELERDLPFSVYVDALDEYVQGLDPTALAALDDDVRTELAHVFPSLSTLASGREAALQHERYRSHRAVQALLEQLAATKPLVLVLDDFHWADSASVELLGALLRRPPGAAVLIAVAVRPRQTPERLSTALERAHRAGTLTRLELGALTSDESRELLGGAVDAAAAALLYEESGGNPFYLEQLARSLDRADTDAAGVPEMSSAVGVPFDRSRVADRGADPVVGHVTRRTRRGGGGRRSIRAGAGGGGGRHIRGVGDGRGRRAPAPRSHSPDQRAAAFPLSASARPACGLRVDARRLAAGCTRALRPGARGARGHGRGARTPRRALGA